MADTVAEKKILIAVDESENSKMALLYVAEFLGGFEGFRACILSVVPVPGVDFFESADARQEWLGEKRESISAMLQRYREILIQSGFAEEKVETELIVVSDKPVSRAIIEKQEEIDACTLVVGRRGVTKHEEFLFGSVSNRVVHTASRCAVWVVEPVCRTEQ